MISRSFAASFVPIVGVPLNIMCSKRWLMPVMPGRSFTLPTLATQPQAIVGSSFRGRRRSFIPFDSVDSWTFSSWAGAGRAPERTQAERRAIPAMRPRGRRRRFAKGFMVTSGSMEPGGVYGARASPSCLSPVFVRPMRRLTPFRRIIGQCSPSVRATR